MSGPADRVFLGGEIHTLGEPDRIHASVAVRDGRIHHVGTNSDVEEFVGGDTEVLDLDGRVVLPGFIDAHTHLTTTGRYLVHADLTTADSPDDAVELLSRRATKVPENEWILGYGYDESTWSERRYLTRGDLDAVAEDRPVAAFREDMHVATVNSLVLDRFRDEMPPGDVVTAGSEPTGVLLEEAIDPIYRVIDAGVAETRQALDAGIGFANAKGITTIHDMVRNSNAPRVYRELDAAGTLTLRVRLNYWTDHLGSIADTGLATNHGSDFVRVGAIKSYTDGSFGGRTAKLSAPYVDAPGDQEDATGEWVVPPDRLREYVDRAEELGLQFAAHAIGDEAIETVLACYERLADPGAARHRIEHVELATDGAIERMADLCVVASMQPNFLKWAGDGGLYESRIGDRRSLTNRFARLAEAGVPLAFGSDGMPMDPLLGVHWAVNAPIEAQRIDVTTALRAYTGGSAYAGFDEDRLGAIERGKLADFVVLDASPWERPGAIAGIGVALTVVDGDIVHDGRV